MPKRGGCYYCGKPAAVIDTANRRLCAKCYTHDDETKAADEDEDERTTPIQPWPVLGVPPKPPKTTDAADATARAIAALSKIKRGSK